jgi:iron complex outermembrane recepter protein
MFTPFLSFGGLNMKFSIFARLLSSACVSSLCLAGHAVAQDAGAAAKTTEPETIIVTGSRIKQSPINSALPLQIITTEDLQREGISSAEQLTSFLTSNGTGSDNLASNSDVVSGQQRGNNGLSSANLRSQGSGATLILLNGRRVAAHGLNGGSVDVNQIPFSAIERVEILKDGASAIYGTDAIGGVINYILKKDFTGVKVSGFTDFTQQGGGNIYRASGIVGYGDLTEQGFNIMGAASYSWNKALRGDQRDFVNTFQPDRGLSVDTRGTPFATILPLANSAFPSAGTTPFVPGSTTVRASGGINILDLPGQPGCGVVDGQAPYDEKLWAFPEAQLACAWDTGRAAVLQQPIKTLTYVTRGVVKLGDHEITAEYTGSDADSAKRFSNLQLTPNTSTRNYGFARNATNAATYDKIAGILKATFPTDLALAGRLNAGTRISYRWRCIECGPREIQTNTQTGRAFLGADGPLFAGWDYRTGISYAFSKARSTLGSGYYYQNSGLGVNGIIDALNTGIINPFLFPGETQSQAALDLLKGASAEGVVLYGGKYTTIQIDGSVSGPLFELPGGEAQAAIGVDYREEKYKFNGDARDAASRPFILAAPFDDGNALASRSRTIKAAYAEVLLPVLDSLELSAAVRLDDYTTFGSTFNPKFSFKYKPIQEIMFRGSYNTGFRVPSFNQIFNGISTAAYTGRDIADPANCPGGRVDPARAGCTAIQPDIVFGGNPKLGPEKAKQFSLGVVIQPVSKVSLTVDWWTIKRTDTIVSLTLQQLAENYSLFADRYLRGSSGGPILAIDQRLINAGASTTSGLEISLLGGNELWGGNWSAGIEGTYLLTKKERVVANLPFENQLGKFTFSGDLGLRWKHNAFVSYSHGSWAGTFSQIFRSGYTNQELPGVTSGVVTPSNLDKKVNPYAIYNASISYKGLIEGFKLTAGVKNIFNSDPPFAITYDSNTGSGSSWEPRVADPRGRAFTLLAEYKF